VTQRRRESSQHLDRCDWAVQSPPSSVAGRAENRAATVFRPRRGGICRRDVVQWAHCWRRWQPHCRMRPLPSP